MTRKINLLWLSLCLLALSGFRVQAQPAQVFLVAGQSNADGRPSISTMPQYVQDYVSEGGHPSILWSYTNGTDWAWQQFAGRMTPYMPYTDNKTTNRAGFDAILYHLIDEALQEPFYVIKGTRGGTAIDTRCPSTGNLWWQADADWLQTAAPRSGHSLALEYTQNIGLCIDNVLAPLSQSYDIRCIVWHQGESDRQRAYDYKQNLSTLVSYLRHYLAEKTGRNAYASLPFIAGTANRASLQYSPIVESALWQMAEEDENFHVVDLSDCSLGSDRLHFDAKGCQVAATRMFNKICNLGLLASDTIPVSQAPADSLRLTKAVVRNYDYEFYEDESGPLLNDGTIRMNGKAPYGWAHTWQGYPETPFPARGAVPTLGTGGTFTGGNGKSHCFYTPTGNAMPDGFELYQELPAGTLPPGIYRLTCALGLNVSKLGVTRVFVGDDVLYFGNSLRYDTGKLSTLFPEERMHFAGKTGNDVTRMQNVSLLFLVQEGEPVRFGIRSGALTSRGLESHATGMGGFCTDHWRIVRVSELPVSVSRPAAPNPSPAAVYDLNGRNLSKIPSGQKGVYIIDGRKVAKTR